MVRSQGRTRAATLLALSAVYLAAGKLGLSLALVHASASPVWPPTGIALAAFLALGRRVWPAIFAGAFLVNATTEGNLATSLGIAAGNTLEGVVGAELVWRFAGGTAAFDRPRDVFRFVSADNPERSSFPAGREPTSSSSAFATMVWEFPNRIFTASSRCFMLSIRLGTPQGSDWPS